METKLSTLKSLQSILEDLDEKTDLTVIDEPDSAMIEVTVKAPEPVAGMQKVANLDRFLQGQAHNPDDIVYDHENDQYKLKTKFRTDR